MLISCTMDAPLFSVRMRATLLGRHLAGAERIVPSADVSRVAAELMSRAIADDGDSADDVYCHAERIDPARLLYARLPDLCTWPVDDWHQGREAAATLLCRAGVEPEAATTGLRLLAAGPGPGGSVMRGAVIMDAATGERLESDPARGVRVSRMDVAAACRRDFETRLQRAGLGHRRVLEALVLVGKVLLAPGMVAELCWSDDPDYAVGYVAAPAYGYQRISALKSIGDRKGGRVFFVRAGASVVAELTDFLERQPVLFDRLGAINPATRWGAEHG